MLDAMNLVYTGKSWLAIITYFPQGNKNEAGRYRPYYLSKEHKDADEKDSLSRVFSNFRLRPIAILTWSLTLAPIRYKKLKK